MPKKLTPRQAIALKYYKAYGALCCSDDEDISSLEHVKLREYRKILFMKYKEYDPDNSFNLCRPTTCGYCSYFEDDGSLQKQCHICKQIDEET